MVKILTIVVSMTWNHRPERYRSIISWISFLSLYIYRSNINILPVIMCSIRFVFTTNIKFNQGLCYGVPVVDQVDPWKAWTLIACQSFNFYFHCTFSIKLSEIELYDFINRIKIFYIFRNQRLYRTITFTVIENKQVVK